VTPFILVKRLSLPHLRKSPLRSALVVLGIALGVSVVVASRATSDALEHTFDDMVQRVADRAELLVIGNQSGVPDSLVADIAAVPGVAHAAPALEISTSFASDGEPLLILGVDFLGDTHFVPFTSEHGDRDVVDDPLAFANDPLALLVSKSLASRRKLHVNSTVEVIGAGGVRTLHVRGILQDSGPAASFGGQVAVMFLNAAQLTFGRGMLVDRIDIALDPAVDKQQTQARLRAVLRGGARLEEPKEFGQRARSLSKPLSDGMQISGVMALVVAAFIIYNAVGVSVDQRRREVGVLRALGVLRRDIVLHFCLESVVLAVVGTALGLLLASKLVVLTHEQTRLAVSRVYGTVPHVPKIALEHVVRGTLAAFAISTLGAFFPGRRASRLDPVVALQSAAPGASSKALPYKLIALCGAVLMLASWPVASLGNMAAGYLATVTNILGGALIMPLLIVVLRRLCVRPVQRAFGMSGRLGLDYVERNLGRSTMNVLALMVAVALSPGISGWLHSFETAMKLWFEQVSAADFTVTAGSPLADRRRMPLAPDSVARLQGIEGLALVQPMRMIDQTYGDTSFRLVSSDTRPYLRQAALRAKQWKVIEGASPVNENELYEAPRIVLSENAAHRLGRAVGDRMRLQAPLGAIEFVVRAVVVDYSSELGTGFIDQRFYLQAWGDSAIDVITLYAKPGIDLAAVAGVVRQRLGGGKALFVTQTNALRDELLRSLDEGFAYGRSLELIVLLIAVMGVVSTMVAAVIDRTREIGMLRAIGATRRQITLSMVLEACFLAVCAICGGVALGSLQCILLLRTVVVQNSGWHFSFVFPTANVAQFCAWVLVAAAVAGLVPGLRAARLDVKAALASE
jgi:putative ABC transport system permease protein